MQYNLPNFRIDFRDWMKGNNLYDDYPNAGLKSNAVGYNAFKYPGLLVAQPTLNETAVTGSLKRIPVIAWTGGVNGGGDMQVTAVSSDDASVGGTGYGYVVNGLTGAFTATVDAVAAPTVLTKTYQYGMIEMVHTSNNVVVSHSNGLTELRHQGSTNETFHTTCGLNNFDTLAPHPLAWFEDFIYVGDEEDLHEFEANGNSGTDTVLSLPSRYTITSLQEHQGLLFIAATKFYESPDQFAGGGDVYRRNYKVLTELFTWDGYSESFLDRYPIPDAVSVLLSDEDGRLYVWTHEQFGYFNGLSFVPLRDLENVVYRQHVTKVKNGIMFADGNKLIRYSSILPNGERKFYIHETYTQTIGGIISLLPDVGIVVLNGTGAGVAGKNMAISSIDSGTSGTNRQFEFNTKNIRVAVKVRHVVVETDGLGASGVVKAEYKDSDGNTKTCGTFTYNDVRMANKKRWIFDVHGGSGTTQITPLITLSGTAKLKSVDYYYEPVVDVNNS